jgi:hypothetical protein
MSLGAARDSSMIAPAITANAVNATAIFGGLAVKCSSNTQTLRPMLASGLMTTRTGSDTLSGPTCRAACSRSVPAAAAAARA